MIFSVYKYQKENHLILLRMIEFKFNEEKYSDSESDFSVGIFDKISLSFSLADTLRNRNFIKL